MKNKSQHFPQNDAGFGTKYNSTRLINNDGSVNVERKGISFWKSFSWYHYLIAASRIKFTLIIFVFYLLVNTLFAFVYLFIGLEDMQGVIATSYLDKFWEAFFFSAQTLSTVGYGRLAPTGFATSATATVEALIGLLGFAIATGLFYGRFSKPIARLIYGSKAVIAPYQDGYGLMLRMANARKEHLIEAEVDVIMTLTVEENGKMARKFPILELERRKILLFAQNWTVVHPVNENSPIYGMSADDFKKAGIEIMVFFKAYDEMFNQTVYQRFSYKYDDIIWGAKYTAMLDVNEKGITRIDLSKVGEYEMVTENISALVKTTI